MTKEQRINALIEKLYGKIGHEKGCFYYESWLNHKAVVEVVNDGGGVRTLLTDNTPTALLDKLEAIAEYKKFLNKQ